MPAVVCCHFPVEVVAVRRSSTANRDTAGYDFCKIGGAGAARRELYRLAAAEARPFDQLSGVAWSRFGQSHGDFRGGSCGRQSDAATGKTQNVLNGLTAITESGIDYLQGFLGTTVASPNRVMNDSISS